MTVDVSTFVGGFPFRSLRGDADHLVAELDRVGVQQAWVGHLPSFLYRDPAAGTSELVRLIEPHASRLLPVPTVHPALPGWEEDLNHALELGAPAVRVYPNYQGLEPSGGAMRVWAAAVAALDLPVVLTVRFEDLRQRHPLDVAGDLPAATVRAVVRSDPNIKVLVTNADRGVVEETHYGLTPDEAKRVLWDIAWLWGPPEDHLMHLLETVGPDRFTFGTGMPLRIPDAAVAKLDLLELTSQRRAALMGGNLATWQGRKVQAAKRRAGKRRR
jgi:predicted TIM-barrel fold metal-dependent hydrolase